MNNLIDLEKKINSELTTKINKTSIKHDQIYVDIDKEDLIDVVLFIKTNKDTKFRQLIDITPAKASDLIALKNICISYIFNDDYLTQLAGQ